MWKLRISWYRDRNRVTNTVINHVSQRDRRRDIKKDTEPYMSHNSRYRYKYYRYRYRSRCDIQEDRQRQRAEDTKRSCHSCLCLKPLRSSSQSFAKHRNSQSCKLLSMLTALPIRISCSDWLIPCSPEAHHIGPQEQHLHGVYRWQRHFTPRQALT